MIFKDKKGNLHDTARIRACAPMLEPPACDVVCALLDVIEAGFAVSPKLRPNENPRYDAGFAHGVLDVQRAMGKVIEAHDPILLNPTNLPMSEIYCLLTETGHDLKVEVLSNGSIAAVNVPPNSSEEIPSNRKYLK